MNWYKKLLYAQVWEVDSDESFAEELKAFYELEYKHQCLKNFPFEGMDQRYQNIFSKVEDSLVYTMDNLKGTLLSTFNGWLETHALTDPAMWAAKRSDPYDQGYMSSFDAEQALEGVIGEYIRYKNGGQMPFYNMPNTSNVFSEMLDQALEMSDKFTSLQSAENMVQEIERERLTEDLYNDEFENFGNNERGEAFQSEEEAEAYIEERVEAASVQDYVWSMGKEELLSLLEGQGEMDNFIVELNQHLVFPLWYEYWGAMGIDTTRELAEEAYEGLVNAKNFDEFHLALEVAIQTCHQNGSMLEYLEQYGGEEYGSDPSEIEDIMNELTDGKANANWDKQLMNIGVKIPLAVRKHNKELAKTE
jgi:hypothetical protein